MSDHSTDQGQAATVTARVRRAAARQRIAARLVPEAADRAGVWARLDPDGAVTVTVFSHHPSIDETGEPCDINTNVAVEPSKALTKALQGLLARHTDRLIVAAGADHQEHLSAMRAGLRSDDMDYPDDGDDPDDADEEV